MSIASLLANDSDEDAGHFVTFNSFSGSSTAGGTVSSNDGWLFYMPPAGFTNSDSFSYTISDGVGAPVNGTVTVAVNLTIVPSPNLRITDLFNGSYRLRFDGIPGLVYRIQYTTNLVDWVELNSGTANEFGAFELVDTPPGGSPSRYYRSSYP